MLVTNNKIQSYTLGHKSDKLWKFQEKVKKIEVSPTLPKMNKSMWI